MQTIDSALGPSILDEPISKSRDLYFSYFSPVSAIGNAIGYAKFFSRSHHAGIRVYNEAGSVIETHKHKGDFKEW
jgi:predicted AlkP superfamily pyrophosphatase or phosphodiesterase